MRLDHPTTPVVGRLAPSPTGRLHLGHARTFFLAWLSAKSANGRVILRIEDIDASRVRPGATEAAVDDMRRLGLDWDEGPYVQSQRLATYAESLARLKRLELVYPCTCTRAEIERTASAPHAEDEAPAYPGTCSERTARDGDALGDRPFAWRFRVPDRSIGWNDLIAGRIEFSRKQIGGDFIVARSPFAPSYQLAVIQDDAAMGVTEVVRGEDLVPSTPRQLLLADALGFGERNYAHVPLVYGPDGRRLAKRDESIKLGSLYEAGVDPRLIVGWIAKSFGWIESVEPSEPRDWIGRVDPLRISTDPCRFDPSIFASDQSK